MAPFFLLAVLPAVAADIATELAQLQQEIQSLSSLERPTFDDYKQKHICDPGRQHTLKQVCEPGGREVCEIQTTRWHEVRPLQYQGDPASDQSRKSRQTPMSKARFHSPHYTVTTGSAHGLCVKGSEDCTIQAQGCCECKNPALYVGGQISKCTYYGACNVFACCNEEGNPVHMADFDLAASAPAESAESAGKPAPVAAAPAEEEGDGASEAAGDGEDKKDGGDEAAEGDEAKKEDAPPPNAAKEDSEDI